MAAKDSAKPASELQLERLANLLLLQTRLRDANSELEFGFSAVNDTLTLVAGATAMLWKYPNSDATAQGELFAVSASALPEKNTPFAAWAKNYCTELMSIYGETECLVNKADLPAELNESTLSLLPSEGIWLPLVYKGRLLGALVIMRQEVWTEFELRILQQWASSLSHAWNALRPPRNSLLASVLRLKRSQLAIAAVVVLCLSFVLPVRLSVLAPAELKSADSFVVRSPMQGVIDALQVETNTAVSEGQLLVRLDDTSLKTELEVAEQELQIARAEYRQSSQAAAFNEDASANLQVQRIALEKALARVNYLTDLAGRTQITAPQSGTVIVENTDEFVGRPVQLGERLLSLVDNTSLELELWLPVGDDIELPLGSQVNFFPNAAPATVYKGELTTLDYEAQLSPLGTLAYRARASVEIPESAFSRIGMRGTTKLYGNRVSLFYLIFRRPISFLRQTLGL